MKEILTLTLNPALDRTMYFDTFSAGTLNRSSRSVMAPGGKGINVSRALYRMGVPTRAFSFRGGRCGALLAAMLEEEGLGRVVCRRLGLDVPEPDLREWTNMVHRAESRKDSV